MEKGLINPSDTSSSEHRDVKELTFAQLNTDVQQAGQLQLSHY